MDEYRMARRVLMTEVSGGRVRERPRLGWMKGVKVAAGNRGMTVEAALHNARDMKEWRTLVRMYVFYSHGCNKFLHARMFFTL